MLDLEAIKKLCDGLIAGPFCVESTDNRDRDVALAYDIPRCGSPIFVATVFGADDRENSDNDPITLEMSQRLAKFFAASRELLPQLIAEVERLRATLGDINEAHRIVMDELCASDEKHCTCVPFLRKENERLREGSLPNTTNPLTQADFAALIISMMLPGFRWEMLPNGERGWRWDGYLKDEEMKELYQWIGKEMRNELQSEEVESERKEKFNAAIKKVNEHRSDAFRKLAEQ